MFGLRTSESGEPLKQAAMAEALGAWTKHLTGVVVAGCEAMGWRAAAKGYPGQVLPVSRGEYLALDVVGRDLRKLNSRTLEPLH